MKLPLSAALFFASALLLQAEWSVTKTEPLPAPAALQVSRVSVSGSAGRAELHVVSFSPKVATFAVMDDPAGDVTLATAAQKRGALAAVNGGYFHPDRKPLGLVVRQGAQLHPLERSRLLSGLLVVRDGRIALQRVAEFKSSAAVREAMQAGPFLVDAGKPVTGLNNSRAAARTVVFSDTAGNFGLLVCRYATLAETAEILLTAGVLPRGRIVRALNLDGGSSTGLWVQGEPPLYLREGKDVRNYVAIVPR
jgi:exopolysaccharide biosynthesis protein